MMLSGVESGHLPPNEDLLSMADICLSWGDQRWLAHSQVLALQSNHLAALVAMRKQQPGAVKESLPVVFLSGARPGTVPEGVAAATKNDFSAFLSHIYQRERAFEWDTISGVLRLADYFGAAGVLQQADSWLAGQYRQLVQPLKPLQACTAFELAARHRLGATMAVLLPWAVQCMARGSRCSTVWYDGKQCCARLKAAFEDSQLKCLVLDAYWWSRESQEACAACSCRPADVAASWDTRYEWAGPAHGAGSGGAAGVQPGSLLQQRASLHYAHLLEDANWSCTSVGPAAAVPAFNNSGGGAA